MVHRRVSARRDLKTVFEKEKGDRFIFLEKGDRFIFLYIQKKICPLFQ